MIPVEAHLLLNHVPLIGLVFGLVFFVVGLKRASEPALQAGLRILLSMGIAVVPVVGSGLVSATVLADANWLDTEALSNHQLAGIFTLVVLMGLGTLCGVALVASTTRNGRARRLGSRPPSLSSPSQAWVRAHGLDTSAEPCGTASSGGESLSSGERCTYAVI